MLRLIIYISNFFVVDMITMCLSIVWRLLLLIAGVLLIVSLYYNYIIGVNASFMLWIIIVIVFISVAVRYLSERSG